MDTFLYLAVGIIVGALLGFFIGKARVKPVASDDTAVRLLTAQIEDAKRERQERDERDRKENTLLQTLTPIKDQLEQMRNKVAELETQRNTQYGTIEEQLRQSIATSQSLGKQTETLAKAMSDNQMRGVWGETQLRRLIEEAGLSKIADFSEQAGVEGGAKRPDVTILLPGNKQILIDSKVPFDAYMEASSISDLGSPEELARRDALIKKHSEAVKSHIKALGDKKYWESYADAAPFVIAFIPSESLLSAALQADPSLLEYSFKQGVAIASPVSLFSVLKTITYIWQQEANEKALANVIKLGKDLYARIAVVAKHASALGKSLDGAVGNYNKFASSLERNLLTTAREANAIDATQFGKTDIPEIGGLVETTSQFTKPELETLEIEAEIVEDE
ncbi:MAG: DNA recombination protein RmuC [Rhodoluna sp.]|nr:DNA recombination protein RmuC [Rhodoluna sp.]